MRVFEEPYELATTTFNNGDKVVIVLIFDEIVASADYVSVTTPLSDSAFVLQGGPGTNVLYFAGTVSGHGGYTPTKNNITVNNSTNIKDMCN